ncbi:MAG: hypothetical protein GWN18_16375, partial [Thermoplasmata archaeon]|nr:hypothetical protein [Thermoplasmata archaeon]NIS13649.1 hypothetical protein [Thermoplasmata archaeon]NIV80282.1 hypothetical protein [Thermoplasmata archaeon]NIW84095.1 hypothetical protein [Thermoplasmata archaeon]NIW90362.1 hypothetical protein [Thermoplasmata archaeon]
MATGNLNDTSLSLEYSTNNGTSWTSIATRQGNTGFYKWTVPSTETSGALIRVTVIDIDGMMAVDTSDATFAIDPPAPKAGVFHTPAEGDDLTPGAVMLSWTVEDPWGLSEAPLSLELTTDGGITWTQLASGMPFTDGIQWDVPALATSSQECRMRLSVRSWLGDVSVIESGQFTIDVAPPVISWDELPGRMTEGRTYEVAVTARDDLALEETVLHVGGAQGERAYAMSEAGDGLWTFGYEALEGDETMWVSASDGAHTVETSVVSLDVVEGAAATGGASASLAFELALAAVLAISVT